MKLPLLVAITLTGLGIASISAQTGTPSNRDSAVFDANISLASAALNGAAAGTEMTTALAIANDAYRKMPDGSSVEFELLSNTVVATLTAPHLKRQVNLTPEQFNQLLSIGKLDYVSAHGGAVEVLTQIARQHGKEMVARPLTIKQSIPAANMQSAPVADATAARSTAADAPDMRPFAPRWLAEGRPDKYRVLPSDYRGPPSSAMQTDMSTEDGIRAQANRIFPFASQTEQREKWIADRLSEQLDREQGQSYSVRINTR